MDFEAIQIFLRLVERGSFTAAAAQLGLSPTTIRRRIKSLEAALGVQLLYRTTRRVRVTQIGRDYYERCLQAETILDEANRTVLALRTEPRGTLRVVMPYAPGLMVLEPELTKFHSRYPNVVLVLTYDNRPLDLIEHGFDVALRSGPLPDSGYSARPLGASRGKLAASPAYLARQGRPAGPDDLAGHAILAVGGDAPTATWHLRNEAGATADVVVRPILIANESVTVIRQAVNGAGIVLMSTHLTSHLLAQGKLEVVLPRWHRANDVELHAVFPRRATLDRKVRAFVDFAAEVFSSWDIAR